MVLRIRRSLSRQVTLSGQVNNGIALRAIKRPLASFSPLRPTGARVPAGNCKKAARDRQMCSRVLAVPPRLGIGGARQIACVE